MRGWVRIIPNDTLFFRSGMPFTMGDDTWTDTVFPPYPYTVFGALTTYIIASNRGFSAFSTGFQSHSVISELIGPIVLYNNIPYFPVPLDLVAVEIQSELRKLSYISRPDIFVSDLNMENVLVYLNCEESGKAENVGGFVDLDEIQRYLRGEDNIRYLRSSLIYTVEPKIGIKINYDTRTSQEGYLYRTSFLRMLSSGYYDSGMIAKVNASEDFDDGILQLGGEGKTARIEKVGDENSIFIKYLEAQEVFSNLENQNSVNEFKIYLATPSMFKKGWLPEWIDENSFEGEVSSGNVSIKLKLTACVIGKPIRIGGWDMLNKSPKPMYKAVPAGSVYYFRVLNKCSWKDILDYFHFKNISDVEREKGFGLSFVGIVKP